MSAIRARFLLLAMLAIGCQRPSDREAIELVQTYNQKVIEAFRRGDARVIEDVTGPAEAKKLTGLIGVKLDMDLTLDAQLLEFTVLKVERARGEVSVHTEERWHYLDRRIGTGKQVGQDSTDHYRMIYRLRRPEKRWVVDEIKFEAPPEVGRSEVPNRADVSVMHGSMSTLKPSEDWAPKAQPGKEGR